MAKDAATWHACVERLKTFQQQQQSILTSTYTQTLPFTATHDSKQYNEIKHTNGIFNGWSDVTSKNHEEEDNETWSWKRVKIPLEVSVKYCTRRKAVQITAVRIPTLSYRDDRNYEVRNHNSSSTVYEHLNTVVAPMRYFTVTTLPSRDQDELVNGPDKYHAYIKFQIYTRYIPQVI
uniref:Uncharacterized protein n=1 Tax=Glossina pallidipes TaxID=7398 RepID=A0A1A9Z7U0_GLOPL